MKPKFLLNMNQKIVFNYFLTIRGGSLKKIAKKITTSVPISKKVYTNASITYLLIINLKPTFLYNTLLLSSLITKFLECTKFNLF